MRVRKNANSLSDDEVRDFVEAVRALKTTFEPGSSLSVYDTFVAEHAESFAFGQAHGGPAFFPWHRQFLLEFENALRRVPGHENVTIPYWDFAADNTAAARIFQSDFLGGNGDPKNNFVVTDGPFRQGEWELRFDGPDLRRQFGFFIPTLPTTDDVRAALAVSLYDVFPFDVGSPILESFRNFLEGFNHPTGEPEIHNRVHAWLGGSSAIIFSPNDPVFWLLHANIDRIWAEWEALYGLNNYAPLEPLTDGRTGHGLFEPMVPFDNVRPVDVLDHRALGYIYDTELAGVAVPEPASVVLCGLGVAALLVHAWRRRRRVA